ncbi:hypothetical protein [Prauserella cavernicola]|uniref:Uncharacterized protein n=1 Tax=Prauserella cavernicola TaxID=2800127 RepID=A0A934V8S1_9PSEU|nr:hypothetical protein [Prauserella cavernicola]MBK1788083.1 hypothetical protein [Prauserella cavernicola]
MTDRTLKSPPPQGGSEDLQDQILAAELKLMTEEPLTAEEQRLLAYTVFSGGCSSCPR